MRTLLFYPLPPGEGGGPRSGEGEGILPPLPNYALTPRIRSTLSQWERVGELAFLP